MPTALTVRVLFADNASELLAVTPAPVVSVRLPVKLTAWLTVMFPAVASPMTRVPAVMRVSSAADKPRLSVPLTTSLPPRLISVPAVCVLTVVWPAPELMALAKSTETLFDVISRFALELDVSIAASNKARPVLPLLIAVILTLPPPEVIKASDVVSNTPKLLAAVEFAVPVTVNVPAPPADSVPPNSTETPFALTPAPPVPDTVTAPPAEVMMELVEEMVTP